jgi:CheY-like chemotaxis protein
MDMVSGRETILVVDDEIIVLSLTSLMLRRFGYGVLTAATAAEALRLVARRPDIRIDLLLVDIILPVMNGLVLADRMKELRPDLPVLFMSGHSEQELLVTVLSRKIPYLPKPFTSLQLTRRIRELLDREPVKSMAASTSTDG